MGDVPRIAPRPLFVDRFDSDSRANYTYLVGASSGLSVSGGNLVNADATQKLIAPTGFTARKSFIAKAQMTIPATGSSAAGLGLKLISASNHVYTSFDTAAGSLTMWKMVGGTLTKIDETTVSGGVRTSLWVLGGCLGDCFFANCYAADPETTVATPLAAIALDISDASIRGNVAGKPGLEIFLGAATTYSELKVWAAGAHPFNL